MGVLNAHSTVRTGCGARGFTLIEVLASCAIVAVLIAIVAPALRSSRAAAQTVRLQSTLAQLHVATAAYLSESRETFPYLGFTAEPWRGIHLEGTPTTPLYFSQSKYYINLLVPSYFDSRAIADQPGDFGTKSRAADAFMTPYWFTNAAFAAPEYWAGKTPPTSLSLYRAVRLHETTFPSRKVLILHSLSGFLSPLPGNERQWYNAVAVDGSILRRRATPSFLGHATERPYGAMPLPCISTPDGMAGVDTQ